MSAAEQIVFEDMPADLAETVKDRLMAACDTEAVLPVATYRQRIIRAARASQRAFDRSAR